MFYLLHTDALTCEYAETLKILIYKETKRNDKNTAPPLKVDEETPDPVPFNERKIIMSDEEIIDICRFSSPFGLKADLKVTKEVIRYKEIWTDWEFKNSYFASCNISMVHPHCTYTYYACICRYIHYIYGKC